MSASSWLLYGISVFIWGTAFYAIELQLGFVSVYASLTYRFVMASIIFFAWCRWRGHSLSFSPRVHGYFMLLGMLLFGFNFVGAYEAQNYIPSALNAIVFSSIMWMNILNARLFLGTPITRPIIIGALLGIAGILVLFWPEVSRLSLSDAVLRGAAISFWGALMASLGNILSQKLQQRSLPVLPSVAWGTLYGALLNAGLVLVRGDPWAFDPSPAYVGSLIYLTVFASVITFAFYLTLVGRIGAHRAGYGMVMFPIVAVVISSLFEGLQLETHILLGLFLALSGNVLILGVSEMRVRPINRSGTR